MSGYFCTILQFCQRNLRNTVIFLHLPVGLAVASTFKREALLEFLESERPSENLRALIPVPLGPEEDEEEEEEEEEVELDPFLGSTTPTKRRCVS